MSEHIKTGGEIANNIIKTRMMNLFEKTENRKENYESEEWASLSWLKEQIKNRIGKEEDDVDSGFNSGLHTVLSILEEKKKWSDMMNEIICDKRARCLDYPICCADCKHNEKEHYFIKRIKSR